MRRNLFLFLALLCIGLIFPFRSFATNPVDSGANDKQINRVGSKAAQAEIDSYMKATNDCSTPSLECLVKNTYTFLQIEMSVNIVGNDCALITESGTCMANAPTDTGEESSVNTGTPVAYKRGVVGDLYSFMGNMYEEKPAATSAYVADIFNSANIATPAYAQGLGFAALDPILELWKKFRNIAYIGFIFIFIVIGFMIMFRAKIGGQTAVTAQQAIPSVIISLIFVTFSYAIAGLMIDFMYVTMYMMVGLFSGEVGTEVINYSIFQLAAELFWSSLSGAAFEANKNIITGTLESAGGAFGELAGVGGYLGGLTITIVLSIAILIATVKLFFELLKSYASVVMNVVISPLILMVGAIPGKNVFKPWIQGLVGNLAAFPTVLLMLIIFKEFTGPISGQATGGFVPPFILNLGLPNSIAYIMGFAIILALPEVVTKVKKGLGANEGFGFEIAKTALDRTKEGWKTGVRGVQTAADWQPVGLSRGIPFRTTGKESAVERFLVGSRANRAKEKDKEDASRSLGGNYRARQGGIYELFQRGKVNYDQANQNAGSGAGARRLNPTNLNNANQQAPAQPGQQQAQPKAARNLPTARNRAPE